MNFYMQENGIFDNELTTTLNVHLYICLHYTNIKAQASLYLIGINVYQLYKYLQPTI